MLCQIPNGAFIMLDEKFMWTDLPENSYLRVSLMEDYESEIAYCKFNNVIQIYLI